MTGFRPYFKVLGTRGDYAKTYNPAAQNMPHKENALFARLGNYRSGSQNGDATAGSNPAVPNGTPQNAGPQPHDFLSLMGPVVAPNLMAKLGAKGG